MPYNPEIHHRRTIRLKEYDYSQAGAYFVTICAWQRECLFGNIVDGKMFLNDLGTIIKKIWCNLPEHFHNTSLDEYVIMPNHFHGILTINKTVGAKQASSALPAFVGDNAANNDGNADKGRASIHGTISDSFSAVIQNFKSVSSRKINKYRNSPGCPVWQRNYYERVIRNDDELSRAREYIVNNPMKWELDKENPVNGN